MSTKNPNDRQPAVPPEGDDLLVSDAERELALGRLREGYVEGRITLDEYSERLDRVLDARTAADLQAATQGLPVGARSTPARPAGPAQPVPNRIVSVMSDTHRQGRWLLSRPVSALAIMSSLRIDLRDSEIPGGEVDVTVHAIMADVKILVPPGVDVVLDELTLMGAQQNKRSAPP